MSLRRKFKDENDYFAYLILVIGIQTSDIMRLKFNHLDSNWSLICKPCIHMTGTRQDSLTSLYYCISISCNRISEKTETTQGCEKIPNKVQASGQKHQNHSTGTHKYGFDGVARRYETIMHHPLLHSKLLPRAGRERKGTRNCLGIFSQ